MIKSLKKINPFEYFNVWPTTQQLFNTTVFLLLGKLVLGITITWLEILIAMVIGFSSDFFVSRIKGEAKPFLHCSSGVVSSFATCVLLRSSNLYVLPLAVLVGVGQKYFLRSSGKHFQNPSNLAVLFALLVFPNSTYLDFNAWGSKYFSLSIVIICAILLLTRVRLLRVSVVTFVLYTVFNYIFVSSSSIVLFKLVSSTTFLLYAFFIINDPMALPRSDRFRFLHVFVVISITFFLFLFWGKKDVNIPLGLLLSSFLVPLWRKFESQEANSFKKPLLICLGTSLIVAFGFYNSGANLKRNLELSVESIKEVIPSERKVVGKVKSQIIESYAELWGKSDQLFKKIWEKPHIESIAISKRENAKGFALKNNGVSLIAKNFNVSEIGFENLPYSPIASGDINRDGLLDLVLGSPIGNLKVFINKGGHEFVDISANIFNEIPKNSEYLSLVDFNNDGFLDLLVLGVHYNDDGKSELFLFDPNEKKFVPSFSGIGQNKYSSGGISVSDVNGDGKLDFYISYGANWLSEDPNMVNVDVSLDEFYVSGKNNIWTNEIEKYFPGRLSKRGYVGMTSLFVDFDQNGKIDFLLGNDFFDPSFVMELDKNRFKLKDKSEIALNTINSMSFFATDLNSDGEMELWENGISNSPPNMKKFNGLNIETSLKVRPSDLQKNIKKLTEYRVNFEYQCNQLEDSLAIEICNSRVRGKVALELDNQAECDKIKFKSLRAQCIRFYLASKNNIYASKRTTKFEIENFPKQLPTNVLLERNTSGAYENRTPEELLYSGWSWAAFPFDIDNNGFIDLYITNGYLDLSHDTNKLFLNKSSSTELSFEDRAPSEGLDFEDNSRGLIIADFDNDGDGDIVINSFDISPRYAENLQSGNSLQIELRSKNNYYALGSLVTVEAGALKLVRSVSMGGIWNSSQPSRLHFGLGKIEKVDKVTIKWPNGEEVTYLDLKKDKIHYIFQ